MRKGIQLRVKLYIEGEDAPAHNFAESTKQAVRDMIAAGHLRHPRLTVTIKDIAEDSDNDSDDAKPPPAAKA